MSTPDGPHVEVQLSFGKPDKKGHTPVVVASGGESYADKGDLASARSRQALLGRIAQRFPGLQEVLPEISKRLEAEAIRHHRPGDQARSEGRDDRDGDDDRGPVRDVLVQLVHDDAEVELFRVGTGTEADGYAWVKIGAAREAIAVRSKAFKTMLVAKYFAAFKKAPTSAAITDAIESINAHAVSGEIEHRVHVRYAFDGERIWVDLANKSAQLVEITCAGWTLVDGNTAAVRFKRPRGMLALPTPVSGGNIAELRAVLPRLTDSQFALAVGFILSSLQPKGPYAFLNVTGEQGSGKSTFGRLICGLIDPREPALRRMPRAEQDLMISLSRSWLLAFDNLSSIGQNASDMLCTVATGGGFATRELYTDDGEKCFDVRRPLYMNGIEDVITSSDLLDRTINIHLGPIETETLRTEQQVMDGFEEARPRLLGLIYDGLCQALANRVPVHITPRTRLANVETWVSAAEPGMGIEAGMFQGAFLTNRQDALLIAIESSPVLLALEKLMARRTRWEGTPQGLLSALSKVADDARIDRRQNWPSNARALRGALTRKKSALAFLGLCVSEPSRACGGNRVRDLSVEKVRRRPSLPSLSSLPLNAARGPQPSQGRSGDGVPVGPVRSRPSSSRGVDDLGVEPVQTEVSQ